MLLFCYAILGKKNYEINAACGPIRSLQSMCISKFKLESIEAKTQMKICTI